MRKIKLGILAVAHYDEHIDQWIAACREQSDLVDAVLIDLSSATWLEQIMSQNFDGLLTNPPNLTMAQKNMYDERLDVLHNDLQIPIYPSLLETKIYENKRYLAYWLQANQIPHPETYVFYQQKEALEFISHYNAPLVGKTNIGASGRGIKILKDKASQSRYVHESFKHGAPRDIGPNWKKKGILKRAINKLLDPKSLQAKLQQYKTEKSEIQKDFIILQEYIPHTFEWRCVCIGDSYFAHKKLVKKEKASGTLLKGYENPPLGLLDFCRNIMLEKHLWSQAIDIFATEDGRYLVNEMQCIFGQSDPYQMLIDGVAGRYCFEAGEWIFEPGNFNGHESFDLRLDHFINMLETKTPEAII